MKIPVRPAFFTFAIVLFSGPAGALEEATQMAEVVVSDSFLADYSGEGVSASVLDGDSLSLWGSDSPRDLTGTVPNFFSTDSGTRGFGDVFSIRGLTNTTFFSSPSVVYYVDGVPYGDVFSYADRLFAVERVDVFRGPQGARFGKNAYGGVVDVRTKRPENDFHGSTSTRAGEYDQFGIDGYVSGALVDDVLKVRVGAGHFERDGFITNTNLGGEEDSIQSTSVNGALYWTPTDRLEFILSGSFESFNDGGPRLVSLGGNPYELSSDLAGMMERETNSEALSVTYDHDDFRLSSVTARREWDLNPYMQDLDLSAFPIASTMIRQDQVQWSEEIRIVSQPDSDDPVAWGLGAYFATGETNHYGRRDFIVPTPFGILPVTEITNYTIDQNDFAIFADGTLDVTESLRFNLGVRYDYVEKDLVRSKMSPLSMVPNFNFSENFDHVTPSLGVEFDLSEDVMLYATTSYAFKPGGFSGFADTASLARYESEKNWASEIGVKANCNDDKVRTRLAAFYYDIEDYQIERTFRGPGIPTPFGSDYLVVNAQDATSYGIELELAVELLPGLTADGTIGFVQTELDTYTDPTGRRLDGNKAPYVPELDWAVGLNYECECGFFTRLEYRGVGETYFDDLNQPALKEEAYGILNAQIGFRHENVTVALFGSNLTEEVYFTNKNADLMVGSPGEPRQIGVVVRMEF